MVVVVNRKGNEPSGSDHRCCMAVVSSCREIWVKSRNERNPCCQLHVSGETAGIKPEEGGDDVKSAWPLYLGLHTRYNGRYNALPSREAELIASKPISVRIGGCNPPP